MILGGRRIHPDHRLPFHARRNFGRNGIVDRSSMFKVLPMTEIFLNHASERNVVLLSFTNIPSFLSFLRPLLSLFLFFFSHASRDILKPFFALIVFDFRPIKVDPAHRARAARLHGELISPRWIRERLRLPSLVRNIPFPSLRNDEEAARPSLRGFLLTCPPPLSRALHSKKYYLSASCHINSPSTR